MSAIRDICANCGNSVAADRCACGHLRQAKTLTPAEREKLRQERLQRQLPYRIIGGGLLALVGYGALALHATYLRGVPDFFFGLAFLIGMVGGFHAVACVLGCFSVKAGEGPRDVCGQRRWRDLPSCCLGCNGASRARVPQMGNRSCLLAQLWTTIPRRLLVIPRERDVSA